jgi:hypothetical protein
VKVCAQISVDICGIMDQSQLGSYSVPDPALHVRCRAAGVLIASTPYSPIRSSPWRTISELPPAIIIMILDYWIETGNLIIDSRRKEKNKKNWTIYIQNCFREWRDRERKKEIERERERRE